MVIVETYEKHDVMLPDQTVQASFKDWAKGRNQKLRNEKLLALVTGSGQKGEMKNREHWLQRVGKRAKSKVASIGSKELAKGRKLGHQHHMQ